MSEKNTFILKYHFRFFVTFFCILATLGFAGIAWMMILDHNIVFSLGVICIALFMAWVSVVQVILPINKYHFFIDRNQNFMLINFGLGATKKILLSDIRGVALSWRTIKGNTTDFVQLAVSPDVWCQFYQKAEKQVEYKQDYEELYIVFVVSNQKDNEMNALIHFLVESGIPKRSFVQPVLGKYPGVPRMSKSQINGRSENPIVTKQKRRKRVSKIVDIIFIILGLMILLSRLLRLFF
ncbi:hypothetical protein [Enterococcus faecalis]|uniref:hypothetical protein n=1 Tax=Enterococcus faecalis TaxID=1351 RepID=UPI00076FB872|nr:hypothetical protein [Enterococcus faecalis]